MITATMTTNDLAKTLSGVSGQIKKNIAIAVNDTARYAKSQIAKDVQSTGINIVQRDIKAALVSGNRAVATSLSTTVTVKKGKRFGLDVFKAKESKRGGVTYKMAKGGGSRTIRNAFIPNKYGGKVYIRKGKTRGPLRQMRGVSAWGVFVKNNQSAAIGKKVEAELNKQIGRRIRFLQLKAQGKI